jgi:hypothetical protein
VGECPERTTIVERSVEQEYRRTNDESGSQKVVREGVLSTDADVERTELEGLGDFGGAPVVQPDVRDESPLTPSVASSQAAAATQVEQ